MKRLCSQGDYKWYTHFKQVLYDLELYNKQYLWLINDIEAYPRKEKYQELLDSNEYLLLTTSELVNIFLALLELLKMIFNGYGLCFLQFLINIRKKIYCSLICHTLRTLKKGSIIHILMNLNCNTRIQILKSMRSIVLICL